MTYQKEIGDLGETLAAKFLGDRGYRLVERNYNTRYGELDLVVMEAETRNIVFVEVKTRTSDLFGTPEESVTSAKIERLQNAALLWLQDHPEVVDDWRIDVIAIKLDRQRKLQDLQHFVNIN